MIRIGSSPQHLSDAEYHLKEAAKLYGEWGAKAKARRLRKAHASLLGPDSEIHLELEFSSRTP